MSWNSGGNTYGFAGTPVLEAGVSGTYNTHVSATAATAPTTPPISTCPGRITAAHPGSASSCPLTARCRMPKATAASAPRMPPTQLALSSVATAEMPIISSASGPHIATIHAKLPVFFIPAIEIKTKEPVFRLTNQCM
uniref:hypothetical protein n=1 Tax=Herbidospora sakaeratensis TaxID=564415 RepID=UPI0012FCB5A7|nr:hypothetical protein [Herbidospora sakaeratensis]